MAALTEASAPNQALALQAEILSRPMTENRPTIRQDGLEIFFYSDRTGGQGSSDLWTSTRSSADATVLPASRPASTSAFGTLRARAISAAGLFQGRVSPQRCHSAIMAATSASSIGAIDNEVAGGGFTAPCRDS